MLIAHVGQAPEPHDVWTAWNVDPWTVTPLALGILLYVRAFRRMPAALRPGRVRIGATAAAAFVLLVAVVSPLDALGEALASAHMVQHLLLSLAAAPLLIIGRPWELGPWVVDRPLRKALGRRRRTWRRGLDHVMSPWIAGSLSVLVLTLWHAQGPYQAALTSPTVHAAEHGMFLLSGLVLWGVIGRGIAGPGTPDGSIVILVFLVAMHGVFLSALMTFAGRAWYPAYAETTSAWGLTALADQHLAGVIMWVWGSLSYVGAVVAAMARWIESSGAGEVVAENWR